MSSYYILDGVRDFPVESILILRAFQHPELEVLRYFISVWNLPLQFGILAELLRYATRGVSFTLCPDTIECGSIEFRINVLPIKT